MPRTGSRDHNRGCVAAELIHQLNLKIIVMFNEPLICWKIWVSQSSLRDKMWSLVCCVKRVKNTCNLIIDVVKPVVSNFARLFFLFFLLFKEEKKAGRRLDRLSFSFGYVCLLFLWPTTATTKQQQI